MLARPEKEPKTPLGSRLREVRSYLGNEDRELFATAVGVSRAALAYYERGERTPDAVVLARYRAKLGISLDWLIAGEGEMFADPTKAPVSKDMRSIDKHVFRLVGRFVVGLYKTEDITLPPDALLDEQSSAYNTLIERAENPDDLEELESLLPWLETRLKRQIKAAKAKLGTGKQRA